MLIAMRKGMTDQSVSSFKEPATGRGISEAERLRYLMTKKMRTTLMSSVKKIVTPTK
jgi:hypothetical protein